MAEDPRLRREQQAADAALGELDQIGQYLQSVGFPAPRHRPILEAVQTAIQTQHQILAMMVEQAGGTVALPGPIDAQVPLHRYINNTIEPPTVVFTNGPIAERERTEECKSCGAQTIARLPACLSCGTRKSLPLPEDG